MQTSTIIYRGGNPFFLPSFLWKWEKTSELQCAKTTTKKLTLPKKADTAETHHHHVPQGEGKEGFYIRWWCICVCIGLCFNPLLSPVSARREIRLTTFKKASIERLEVCVCVEKGGTERGREESNNQNTKTVDLRRSRNRKGRKRSHYGEKCFTKARFFPPR